MDKADLAQVTLKDEADLVAVYDWTFWKPY